MKKESRFCREENYSDETAIVWIWERRKRSFGNISRLTELMTGI